MSGDDEVLFGRMLASVWVKPSAAGVPPDAVAPTFTVGSITSLPDVLVKIEQNGGVAFAKRDGDDEG